MDIVLTLVVNPGQGPSLEKAVVSLHSHLGSGKLEVATLAAKRAIDLHFTANSISEVRTRIANAFEQAPEIDWCLQENTPFRRKSMLVADMDSTMITVECVDELADYVGAKQQVSKITEAAMRGDLDFESALRERVALLKGMAVDDLEECYRERVRIMPGAQTLVRTMVEHGGYTALVSGGFTFFTERVSKQIGFQANRANILETEAGKLTGTVTEPICGAAAKLEALNDYCDHLSIEPSAVLAVGDGANDIPMIQAAGLGVAYHAKPKTAAAAHAAVSNGDLTTLLFYQGYCEADFITSQITS